MGFMLITEDGVLKSYNTRVSYDTLPEHLGEHGVSGVTLEWRGIRGYVSDCGLIMPERYRRNPVGSCVLAALGASPQPYAGNVAIVGWVFKPEPDIVPVLPEWAQAAIRDVHTSVTSVLAGLASGHGPEWDREIQELAEHAEHGEIPPISIETIGDWL